MFKAKPGVKFDYLVLMECKIVDEDDMMLLKVDFEITGEGLTRFFFKKGARGARVFRD